MNELARLVEFAAAIPVPKAKAKKEKGGHRWLAGAVIAAPGVPLLKASARFTASALRPRVANVARKVSPDLAKKIHHPGKQIFDYVEGAQQALNKGPGGKLAGAILRKPENTKFRRPEVREHYSSFRAGHREAFASMADEVAVSYRGKVSSSVSSIQRTAKKKRLGSYKDELGHALSDFDILVQKRGYNEREALKHITHGPKHAPLMRKLVPKTSFAPVYAKGTAVLGVVPVGAGAAVASTRKKKKQ